MTSVFDPGSAPVIETVGEGPVDCDIAIVGSGMGGATLAHAIRDSGARVLVVERGDFLPCEDANWSPVEVFQRRRYKNAEKWYDGSTGRPFGPGVHYYVGGNTKVYGACRHASGRRTSGKLSITTASRRPGRSRTRTWSRSTPRPSACMRCTATWVTTRLIRRGRPASRFPARRITFAHQSRPVRRRLRRGQLRSTAAQVGLRQASAWPGKLLGPGRAQLHGAQQHLLPRDGSATPKQNQLPENLGPQRLVPRRARQPVPPGQPANARQDSRTDGQGG